jgi:hypothetical protein
MKNIPKFLNAQGDFFIMKTKQPLDVERNGDE